MAVRARSFPRSRRRLLIVIAAVVVLGAGRMLENLDEYKDTYLFTKRR